MSEINIEFVRTDVISGRYLENTGRNGEIKTLDVTTTGRPAKTYKYRLLPGIPYPMPTVGDLAVVSSAAGFGVIQITEINATVPDTYDKDEMAYVVGIVDVAEYNNFLRNRELKKTLLAQLEQKKKELEQLVTYELLAERNPEFKDLLDKYKSL